LGNSHLSVIGWQLEQPGECGPVRAEFEQPALELEQQHRFPLRFTSISQKL
jgi:hypothetical protein